MSGDLAKWEGLLAGLEAALAEQLDKVKREDFDTAGDLGQRVGQLLSQVGAIRPDGLAGLDERLRGIRELRRQLALTLAQKKQDCLSRAGQVRNGKSMVRAYGQTR